jgi:hypothetical protein
MATVTEPAILTAAAVEALLRECCTVVKPGETLIVRVPADASPRHVHQLGQYVHARAEAMGAAFHTLVVPAESLGVGETSARIVA